MSILLCPKCQAKNAVNRTRCRECNEVLRDRALPRRVDVQSGESRPTDSSLVSQQRSSGSTPSALSSRYRDAYLTARAINGLGEVIKVVSILVGLVIVVVSVKAGEGFGSSISLMIGLLSGTVFGFLGYVGGVLLSAQGQILKATLDSAVNTSPLLNNESRLSIMSLR